MADGLRSKAPRDSSKNAARYNNELAAMIDTELWQQRTFIEGQFSEFESRLDKFHSEV